MKKTYNKPQILFDSFELSQAIAGSCEIISNHVRAMCGVDLRDTTGMILFTDKIAACTMTPGPGQYDDVCYDAPHDEKNVFSS